MFDSISDNIDLLAKLINDPFSLSEQEWIALGIVLLLTVSSLLAAIPVSKIIGFLRERILVKDLHPFYTFNDVQDHKISFVKTRLFSFSPSNFGELHESYIYSNKNNTISFDSFFRKIIDDKDPKRYFFILGESGIGKTAFLINIYLKYVTLYRKRYRIALIPLGNPHALKKIREIAPLSRNTILLMDGFDEMSMATSKNEAVKNLFDEIWEFRKVIITSRTQFFESYQDEPKETSIPKGGSIPGFEDYTPYYVAPFNSKDIRTFLFSRFTVFRIFTIKEAYAILEKASNLMVRPFLLRNIEFLLMNKLERKKLTYSLGVYEVLINNWIKREVSKINNSELRKLYASCLPSLLTALSLKILDKVREGEGYFLTREEINKIAIEHSIDMEFIRSRTLLNRDDEGNIKFSHKSVLEYFIAIVALNDNEVLQLVRTNPALDVCNMFLDEYFFISKIKPLLENCKGFYYEKGQRDSIILQKMSIKSMYSATAIHLTHFEGSSELNCLNEFKNLNEVILHLKADTISLSEIYEVTYMNYKELLFYLCDNIYASQNHYVFPQILDLFDSLNARFEREMLDDYRAQISIATFQSTFFSMANQEIRLIVKSLIPSLRSREQPAHSNLYIKFEESPQRIGVLMHILIENRFFNIIKQIANVNSRLLRALIEPEKSILDYGSVNFTRSIAIDNSLEKLIRTPIRNFGFLDQVITEIEKVVKAEIIEGQPSEYDFATRFDRLSQKNEVHMQNPQQGIREHRKRYTPKKNKPRFYY